MKRGTLSSLQRFEHVVAIEDVNLTGDGVLYTVYLLSEGLTRDGRISPEAKVLRATPQRPPVPSTRVSVPKAVIRKALQRIS